jgi:hypothetical protein
MITHLGKPDFFVPSAYPQLAAPHLKVNVLGDPYCLEFIDAIASMVVHLSQQRENLDSQKEVPCVMEH